MNQKQISELIDKFEESKLSELSIESEGFSLTLKSERIMNVQAGGYLPSTMPAAAATGAAPTTKMTAGSDSSVADTAVDAKSDTEIIKSPIVGTFYRAPAPDAPPYVEESTVVKAGDSLCVIEAMKIMNKLEADFNCEIIKILAENGGMVEFGAPLFEVKRT